MRYSRGTDTLGEDYEGPNCYIRASNVLGSAGALPAGFGVPPKKQTFISTV